MVIKHLLTPSEKRRLARNRRIIKRRREGLGVSDVRAVARWPKGRLAVLHLRTVFDHVRSETPDSRSLTAHHEPEPPHDPSHGEFTATPTRTIW